MTGLPLIQKKAFEMVTEINTDQESFQSQLERLYAAYDHSDNALKQMREMGWSQFQTLGLPTRKIEAYQYLRLRQLFAKKLEILPPAALSVEQVAPYILPECQNSAVVFVNGCLNLGLSRLNGLPKKALAISLPEALRSFRALISNHIFKSLQEETDPFAALNTAFIDQAFFFYLPPQVILENPLQILNFITGSQQIVQPHAELFFGALSSAKVINSVIHLDSSQNFLNNAIYFSLEESAKVIYERSYIKSPFSKETSSEEWHFDATRASLKKDAIFRAVTAQNGAQCFRDDYKVSLIGPNADAHLSGVGMLNGKQEAHTHVLMVHKAPHCRSLQLFKAALAGTCRSSFEGKIYVHQEAQKTEAFQLNNNLLLSDHAQADCKPNLEIFADDVKASHGATVGQLDAEELFYLQARGLSSDSAKSLLIRGFCHEVIDQFSTPSLIKSSSEWAENFLKE